MSIVRAGAGRVNFFSSDAFLFSVAKVGFPGRPHGLEVVEVDGSRFRLLKVANQYVVRWPFLDFFEPLPEPGDAHSSLSYLPVVSRRVLRAEEWKPEMATEEVQPAPFVDWSCFSSWEEFQKRLRERPGYRPYSPQDTQRRRRKVEREIGSLRFTLHDSSPSVFERCLRWKSGQYVATGLKDLFAERRNVELFRELHSRDLLTVSTLHAGDRLGAVHIGVVFDKRFYSWVPAYDPDLQQYAVGRLLLEELLAYSHRSGHAQFDFIVGGESYKFCYATHVRVVEPAGKPPVTLVAARAAKRRVKSVLVRVPFLWQWTEPLRRALRR
jgi:hypothetical protein